MSKSVFIVNPVDGGRSELPQIPDYEAQEGFDDQVALWRDAGYNVLLDVQPYTTVAKVWSENALVLIFELTVKA